MLRGMLLRISEAWGERRNLVRSSAIGAVMPRAGPATVSAYPRREIAREQESLDLSEVGTTPPRPRPQLAPGNLCTRKSSTGPLQTLIMRDKNASPGKVFNFKPRAEWTNEGEVDL